MKNTSQKKLAALVRKTQISIMRACPPLCSLIANDSFRERQSRVKSLIPLVAQVPRALLRHLDDKRKKRVVLGQVYFSITTRCTLNCDKCMMRIPDLTIRKDTPTEELLGDIDALFTRVDYIYNFFLFGGEPFMHPDFDQIIRACAAWGKIENINISTNGTIIPGPRVLTALRETKACVIISKYRPEIQPNMERLKEVLTENGICHYDFLAGTDNWVDTDSFGQIKEGSPTRRFSDCILPLYNTYMGGQLHLCCQSAVVAYDSRIPECREDYIDVRSVAPEEFREKLIRLKKKTAVSACSYCLGQTYNTPTIPAAVQREAGNPG